jgi:hypothetical protein
MTRSLGLQISELDPPLIHQFEHNESAATR